MHIDYLVIGQGLCGTWLSWYLQKEKQSFLVIDNNREDTPSKIAAGIINPVTGRRMVTTWMIDELLPFAWQAYSEMGSLLNIAAISQKNIIDFFPSPQMLEAFRKRVSEEAQYLHAYPEQNHFTSLFRYEFGCGEIRPVYMAHTEAILPAWKMFLKNAGAFVEENFDIDELIVEEDRIRYKDITAEKILFCDGVHAFGNPYFRLLPFAPNKGEVLIAEIPDLPYHAIYKKGILLAPLTVKNHFWIGSNYTWEFADPNPTRAFRESTEQLLNSWLKLPFKIVDHKAGVRPATLERRPFVGLHPFHKRVGLLNGMGTKGCSLAPYFARHFAEHLLQQTPLMPEADINRFHKILSRG